MPIPHCPICGQERGRHQERYCEIMKIIWGVPAKPVEPPKEDTV